MLDVGQMGFYMLNNRVHSAPIQARMIVDNLHDEWANTKAQKEMWSPFGPPGVTYSTCHGLFCDGEIFASKEDLLASL